MKGLFGETTGQRIPRRKYAATAAFAVETSD
jgi:hypothetical protein